MIAEWMFQLRPRTGDGTSLLFQKVKCYTERLLDLSVRDYLLLFPVLADKMWVLSVHCRMRTCCRVLFYSIKADKARIARLRLLLVICLQNSPNISQRDKNYILMWQFIGTSEWDHGARTTETSSICRVQFNGHERSYGADLKLHRVDSTNVR